MTAPPQLSVIMPSFNQGRYIRMAIDSVLSHRDSPVELIVMDGGSTDETTDVLHRYRSRLSFTSERDRGQADALNRGFQRARGDVVCWLNSDDMFTPGALGRVMRVFRDNPSVDFAYSRGWNVDEDGRIIDEAGVLPFDLWRLIHQRNFIQQPSCFFRRSLLERVGPFDENLQYVMDWDLWIRFSAYRGLYVDDFWSYNRVHRGNKTQQGQLRRWREIRGMIRRYTNVRRPPVVRLYLLEALIQLMQSRGLPPHLEHPLVRERERGMRRSMSGRHVDGSVRPRFRFSVGNVPGQRDLLLTLSPVSRYQRSRLGAPALTVHWRSNAGARGLFTLVENGAPQQFAISPGPSPTPFTHITCWTDDPGVLFERASPLPTRRIIGFLDDVDTDPQAPPARRARPLSATRAMPTAADPASGSAAPAVDERPGAAPCWCGGAVWEPLGDHHRRCAHCGTATLAAPTSTSDGVEEQPPWQARVGSRRDVAPADLRERTLTEVAGRCALDLAGLLDLISPPGRVLEVGCGHGGFVCLLNEAGFDAMGTELSPWMADFARSIFGVRVELGSLETLPLEPGFLAVCGSYLLERARDPVRVARRLADLVYTTGVVRLRAFRYRGQGLQGEVFRTPSLRALFSEKAIRRLLESVGFRAVAIEPGPDPDEMWVSAARGPLPRQRPEQRVVSVLPVWTRGLDGLRRELARAEQLRGEAEADARSHLGHVEALIQRLGAAEGEHTAQLGQVATLTRLLQEAEADRTARLVQIETLTACLQEAEADRTARLVQIETLTACLQEAEADRTARFAQIETLTARLQEAETDRNARFTQIETLAACLQQVEARLRQAHIDSDVLRQRLEAILRTRVWRTYRFVTGAWPRDR